MEEDTLMNTSNYMNAILDWPYDKSPTIDGEIINVTMWFDTINGLKPVWQYWDRYSECETEWREATDKEIADALAIALKEELIYRKKNQSAVSFAHSFARLLKDINHEQNK